jgi:catechol 2,3-dioxygenase-like lactoylglutathione lyase family enzyme
MMDEIKFNHIGIFTGHHKRLLDFYLPVLGFKKEYQAILPAEVMYPIFGIPHECHMIKLIGGGITLEIFWLDDYKLKGKGRWMSGYNHFGLEVKDRDRFIKRLKARFKARIVKVDRGGHFAYFIRDPDGNLIEVKEALKK